MIVTPTVSVIVLILAIIMIIYTFKNTDNVVPVMNKLRHMNDPIYGCTRYKELGCAHVDGYLCDYPNCSMQDLEFDIVRFSTDFELGGFVYITIREREFAMMYSYDIHKPEVCHFTLSPVDSYGLVDVNKYPTIATKYLDTGGSMIKRCKVPSVGMRTELISVVEELVNEYQKTKGK